MKTIEQKVADAILQKPTEIQIGEKKYTVAPPSVATLILVSETVSLLPHLKLEDTNVAKEVLSVAKDCRMLGDIAAIMILGASNLTETVQKPTIITRRALWGLIKLNHTYVRDVVIDKKKQLAQEIIETLSPSELHALVTRLLSNMELGDFFAVTTFLTEVNLMRPTKVEN